MTRGQMTWWWAGALLLGSLGCAQQVTTPSGGAAGASGDGGVSGLGGSPSGGTAGSSTSSTGGTGGTGGTVPPMCTEASECMGLANDCNDADCVDGQCKAIPKDNFKPCDDKNACTSNDQCSAGLCAGAPKSCGQASVCHIMKCNAGSGECEEMPGDDSAPCDDQDPCTYSGTCQDGVCSKGKPVDCSLFDTKCSIGLCDPQTGCKPMPFNEGASCDDSKFCTINEVCQNGTCGGGQATPCAPPGGCFVGMCDELNNACTTVPGNDGVACDDGSPCTEGTTCSNGACLGGAPANEGIACDDGTACTAGEFCSAGVCGGGSGPSVYFSEDFSDNSAGWVLGAEWQIGPAKEGFTNGFGYPDPEKDHTLTADDGVAGAIIGGDVDTNPHPYSYIESPAFNTENAAGKIILGYFRWLNSDSHPYMHNRVDVWNGNQWINVWASGDEFFDGNWTFVTHDLTNYKNAAMRVRFGFDVKEFAFSSYSGWNLDDVLVASQACP
jgi:hypothetical protein